MYKPLQVFHYKQFKQNSIRYIHICKITLLVEKVRSHYHGSFQIAQIPQAILCARYSFYSLRFSFSPKQSSRWFDHIHLNISVALNSFRGNFISIFCRSRYLLLTHSWHNRKDFSRIKRKEKANYAVQTREKLQRHERKCLQKFWSFNIPFQSKGVILRRDVKLCYVWAEFDKSYRVFHSPRRRGPKCRTRRSCRNILCIRTWTSQRKTRGRLAKWDVW